MNDYNKIVLFPGQTKFINCIEKFVDIQYFFFITGYGAGKSFSIILLILLITKKYYNIPLKIGIGGITLDKIQKYILDDLFKILIIRQINYDYNKTTHVLKIGQVIFYCIPLETPDLIYGYNLDIFFCDEIDELKVEICLKLFKAIAERTRGKNLIDRKPFMCFTTTTQGKRRGCYLKRKELKKQNVKFCVVRANTKENTHIADSYYEGLSQIYNEEEKKAFLEGKDVDFVTGLVYPDFTEKNIIDPFEIMSNETIYVGQDLNEGFNKTICIIKKDKKLYIIKVLSIKNIGDVPTILRNIFPTQAIFYFPDVGGQSKTIINAYLNELRLNNIQIRMGTINPNIVERIFIVNKLFKLDKLFIFNKECEEYIKALQIRCFNQLGMPEKDKGENDPSHCCDSGEYVLFRIVSMDIDFIKFMRTIKRVK